MVPFYRGNHANPHSIHHFLGIKASGAIECARAQIAYNINANPNEIVFTSGATESNNLAIIGASSKAPQSKRCILISAIEHKCVLEAALHLQKSGFSVKYIPINAEGVVNLNALKQLLSDHDVFMISIMAINNEIGSIQPIKESAKIAHAHGALIHCDAAQATTNSRVNVEEWEVDFLSLSSHKMNGPKGVGALYISGESRSSINPIQFGGGQENGMRSGTLPTALCVGFGAAANYWTKNGDDLRANIKNLRNHFWSKLQNTIPNARLMGPKLSERHKGNLCIHFPDIDAELLLGMIQFKVGASTGSACTSGIPEPSHVISAIGDDDALTDGAIRFSFGPETSYSDLDKAVSCIAIAVKSLIEKT